MSVRRNDRPVCGVEHLFTNMSKVASWSGDGRDIRSGSHQKFDADDTIPDYQMAIRHG